MKRKDMNFNERTACSGVIFVLIGTAMKYKMFAMLAIQDRAVILRYLIAPIVK